MSNQQKPRDIRSFTPDEQLRLLEQIENILLNALCADLLGVKAPQVAPVAPAVPVVPDFTAEALQEVEGILS